MTVHLYVLPVLHLVDPNYNVPKYLPHRFNPALVGLENVPWAWETYLLEDIALLIALFVIVAALFAHMNFGDGNQNNNHKSNNNRARAVRRSNPSGPC